MKVVRQLIREFWLPLIVAIAWSAYNALTDPQHGLSLTDFVNVAAPTFFFASWMTAQWFRVRKQETVASSLGTIEQRSEALLVNIERQTADLSYVANASIIQTFDDCIDALRESNEEIADKTRRIRLGDEFDALPFSLYKTNPFYECRRNLASLISYMGHIDAIGRAEALEPRFTRSSHYIEETGGHIRSLLRQLDNRRLEWRTARSISLVNEISDKIDRFRESFLPHSRYASEGYKGGQRLAEVMESHSSQLRKLCGTIASD